MGFYWTTLFQDAKNYVQTCDSCQRMGHPIRSYEIPLQPQLVIETFERWALDFVGPINPPARHTGAHYIITVTKYP